MNQTSPRTHRTPMTQATLEARASARAHDEHVHIFSVAGMPGCYTTKSKSSPGERHSLVAGPDGIIGCSCEGFTRRQSCKHAAALLARRAREQVRARRQLQHAARCTLTATGERYMATEGSRPAKALPANVVRFEGAVRIVESACDLWN